MLTFTDTHTSALHPKYFFQKRILFALTSLNPSLSSLIFYTAFTKLSLISHISLFFHFVLYFPIVSEDQEILPIVSFSLLPTLTPLVFFPLYILFHITPFVIHEISLPSTTFSTCTIFFYIYRTYELSPPSIHLCVSPFQDISTSPPTLVPSLSLFHFQILYISSLYIINQQHYQY